ncbi:MAG: molybdopterin converting factor subunit 1 [Betaproteobacteria bacterium]|nr:molybdopterin converting factor subunit 1 [Betaproteobacteria bacterium]
MKVSIRYFASLREAIGLSQEDLDLHSSVNTVAALRRHLSDLSDGRAEALAPHKAVRAAIDQMMCDEAAEIYDGCEVAFFPPVTGG